MSNIDLFNMLLAVAVLVFAAYVAGTQNRRKKAASRRNLHDGGFVG